MLCSLAIQKKTTHTHIHTNNFSKHTQKNNQRML
jgi:hypothetical protein